MLLKELLDDEREEGKIEGRNEGQARVNRLNELLAEQQRMDDIIRASKDEAYQMELFKEFDL